MADRDPLLLADEDLLAECVVETLRGSGPGGQHRNKTDSGVRLRHRPTGAIGQAFERRSQAQNRAVALHRLRRAIALGLRSDVDTPAFVPSMALRAILPDARPRLRPKHDLFWAGARDLLDLFLATGCSVADTGGALGLSTGATSRLLLSDPDLVAAANRLRAGAGLGALR